MNIERAPPMDTRVMEIDASYGLAPGPVFDELQKGTIVVLRNLPEIHQLGVTLRRLAGDFGGSTCEAEIAELMRDGDVTRLETLANLYRAFRHLRDSRYLSCLFSDVIASIGLPSPILIDSGYCRMVVPSYAAKAATCPTLFDPMEFQPRGPNEAEGMISGGAWGNAHRDIDVRHYHFQINFWFPLHDLDANRSLLLFPDSYRRDVPQYGRLSNPDEPDSWGFGSALRIPLRFGDTLLFHSQHLHASPSQARAANRFTVELRVAAACIDDNARIYRRLFWNVKNFASNSADGITAIARAAELAEVQNRSRPFDAIIRGRTAHSIMHYLFRKISASLAAGYIHRSANIFDDVICLDEYCWRSIVSCLDRFDCGEDLWLMLARIAKSQQQQCLVGVALERILSHSQSYFWALEAGRLAAENRLWEIATKCFERAHVLAESSDISLDRYSGKMPPPRDSRQILQLLPATARRAARTFVWFARREGKGASFESPSFDHRVFERPDTTAVASFEYYDFVSVAGLIVAVPAGYSYDPEKLLTKVPGVVVSQSIDEVVEMLGTKVGRRLRYPALIPLLPLHIRNYWLNQIIGNIAVGPIRAIPGVRRMCRWLLRFRG